MGRRDDDAGMLSLPARRTERMANVTVTLPIGMLDRLDDLIEMRVVSHSQAVRDALERYLRSVE